MPPENEEQNTDQTGNEIPAWRQSLGAEGAGLSKFDAAADPVAAVAKSYLHLERSKGGAINLPGQDAPLPEIRSALTKIGVPQDPAGYSANEIKMPDGLALDEARFKQYAELAWQAGIPKAAFNNVVPELAKLEVAEAQQRAETVAKATNETVARLRDTWGNNYEKQIRLAQEAGRAILGDDLADSLFGNQEKGLEGARLGDGRPFETIPGLIERLAELGKSFVSEGGIKELASSVSSEQPSEAEYQSWMGNTENVVALSDRTHPRHEQAKLEFARIRRGAGKSGSVRPGESISATGSHIDRW